MKELASVEDVMRDEWLIVGHDMHWGIWHGVYVPYLRLEGVRLVNFFFFITPFSIGKLVV